MKKIIFISIFTLILSGCGENQEKSELEMCIEGANKSSIIDMGEEAKKDDAVSDFITRGLDGYDEKEKECYKKYK